MQDCKRLCWRWRWLGDDEEVDGIVGDGDDDPCRADGVVYHLRPRRLLGNASRLESFTLHVCAVHNVHNR